MILTPGQVPTMEEWITARAKEKERVLADKARQVAMQKPTDAPEA